MTDENINYTSLENALASMAFWKFVATGILPNEQNKERLQELATFLRLQGQHIADNWEQMNAVADKCGGLTVAWSWNSDRSAVPVIAKVNGSFSETYKMKGESEVPDPSQNELPFERTPNDEN